MSRHLHFYFSQWTNESRAWRSGAFALKAGYATSIDYIGYKGSGLANEQSIGESQRILRIGAEPAPAGSSRIRRALSLPRWWLACLRKANVADTTLVIAHGLAALPIAVRLAKRNRLPLLYDAHELETERAGWAKPIRLIAKWAEGRLIRRCDHVTLVNDSIRDWYLSAYPGIDCSVVRNVPQIPAVIGESTLRSSLGINSQDLVFVYCGALGKGRGLSELIEAFRLCPPDNHLVLVGYGPCLESLKSQANDLSNVHFHDAIPQEELVSFISGADVGIVVICTDALSYELALPNKLFEYAAANLGIILGKGPELRRFAKDYPAARFADLDVESLRDAICAWTQESLKESLEKCAQYSPPNWEDEKARLQEAIEKASENARLRW